MARCESEGGSGSLSNTVVEGGTAAQMTVAFVQTCAPFSPPPWLETDVITLARGIAWLPLPWYLYLLSNGVLTETDPLSAGKFEAGSKVELCGRIFMPPYMPCICG